MRCAMGLTGLLIAGCATTPREEPPPPAQAGVVAPALPRSSFLAPRPAVPEYAVGPVPEWARADPPARGAPVVAATAPVKPTLFEDSPALPPPDPGILATTGYSPLEGERPFLGG